MKFIITSLFYGFVCMVFGQARIDFNHKNHDFGEIKEYGGFVEHVFTFVNGGDQPAKITKVKTSCGCTTPAWTKEEVMPGDTGFIKARYNPRNRPGKFNKTLRLTTTAQSSENNTLRISGFVIPKPKSPEEEYPVRAGNLRLNSRSMNMGRMTTEKIVTKEFGVYNASDEPLQMRYDLMMIPPHITLVMNPTELSPREVGALEITYDPIKKDDLGFLSDNITIQTDSVITERNEFYVLVTIEEYFPEMTTEALERVPKLEISDRVIDFGKVSAGEWVSAEFELRNSGRDKLNFRKIKTNCSCVTYDIKSQNIRGGSSASLKVHFDTSERQGNQYKSVTLFSNDPRTPTQMITLKGYVEKGEG